jgi:uncharacterized membrane protein
MCAACSSRTAGPSAGTGTTAGMTDNVVGMLCYITIVPAIIFLVMEPYNKSRFVRFHCFQMIFFCVAMIAIWIGLTIIGFVPGLIFITFPLHMLVWLGSFIIWIILLIKANQGQMFKLPIIGDLAEKQANAM